MAQNLDRLVAKLQETTGHAPRVHGSQWHTRCPAHADEGESLSFYLTTGGHVLLECEAGCGPGEVMRSLGMVLGDLFGEERPAARPLVNFRSDTPQHESLPPRPKVGPIVRRMDECTAAEVEWLWPGRLPLRKLTLLVGDPGLGKSLVALDVAARVSRGAAMPRFEGEAGLEQSLPGYVSLPGSVVLLSSEDDALDTVRPRLEAAGADLQRVVVLEGIHRKSLAHGKLRRTDFSLDMDLPALEQVIRSLDRCRLVVIDPLAAYVGRRDTYNNVEMRRLLHPLTRLAARTGVAVLGIHHLNKAGRGTAIYRAMGSLAFAAAARSVLAVVADGEEDAERVLVPLKSNLSAHVAGIGYRVGEVVDAEGRGAVAKSLVRVSWGTTPIAVSAAEMLEGSGRRVSGRPAIEEACEWLSSVLAAGPLASAVLRAKAKEDGIHERTLLRAKARLGVATSREGFGVGGSWVWGMASGVVE